MAEAWADWADLKTRYPSGEITDEQYQEAVEAATWMLMVLANGAVHGPQCWVEEYRITHTCEIILRRSPLTEITRVERVQGCGRGAPELIDPAQYCIIRNQTLSFCHGSEFGGMATFDNRWFNGWLLCGCGDDAVRVTYTVGANLPPGTEGLILWLAEQLLRSAVGDTCQLPERIQSISRQGVSWTMLDSMDYLDKGMTGIGKADQWLGAVRRAYPTAIIIDPLRSERLMSMPCAQVHVHAAPTALNWDEDTTDITEQTHIDWGET